MNKLELLKKVSLYLKLHNHVLSSLDPEKKGKCVCNNQCYYYLWDHKSLIRKHEFDYKGYCIKWLDDD
jgi:hypothetical protein